MSLKFVLVSLLVAHFVHGKDEHILSGKILLGEGGAACSFTNLSGHSILIKDLRLTIARSLDGMGNPFHLGKEWTYLRNAGAGFGSDSILISVSGLKISDAERKNLGDKLVLNLRVAKFDPIDRKVGPWERVALTVDLKVPPSQNDAGDGESTEAGKKPRRIVEFDEFEKSTK